MFDRLFNTTGKSDAEAEVRTEQYVDAPLAPVVPSPAQRTRPVFTGMEDHSISLQEAGSLTNNYRKAAGQGAVKGKYFSRAAIEQLLVQEEVVGMRYYYGVGADGTQQMVLVGVNGLGQDLHEGFIFGNPLPASKFQTEPNPLNS
jgi:hypothetical protein